MVVEKPWTALVTGATGIQGSHLLKRLAESDDWQKVYAISRTTPDYKHKKVQHVSANLLEAPIEVLDTLQSARVRGVTHIFHTAFMETGDDVKNVEVNFGMLKTAVEAVERTHSDLVHVYLTTGAKWYGQHLKNNKTPYKEDDPRHFPPNFYYNQEDYLAARVQGGATWTWNTLRPGPICGFSSGSFMNIVTSTALYATLAKELGLTHLRFPGTEAAYRSALDCVDVELLTEAQIYLSTHPGDEQSTANQGFNISNGDVIRWKWIWPVVARHFGMEVGEPQELSLPTVMADKASLWKHIVEENGLQQAAKWEQLGTWTFADFVFHQSDDWFANTNKLKRTGFTGMKIDTEGMWARQLQQLSDMKIIPSYNAGTVPVKGDVKDDVKSQAQRAFGESESKSKSAQKSRQQDRGDVAGAAQNITATGQAAKERTLGAIHSVTDTTSSYVDAAQQKVKEVTQAAVDTTSQKAAEAFHATTETASETAAGAQQKVADTWQAAKYQVTPVEAEHALGESESKRESAQKSSQKGREPDTPSATTGSEAGAPQGEKFNYTDAVVGAAHSLAATGQAAKERTLGAIHSVTGTTSSYVGATQQKAKEYTRSTQAAVNASSQKVAEGFHAATETASETAAGAQQKVGDTWQAANYQVTPVEESTSTGHGEKPDHRQVKSGDTATEKPTGGKARGGLTPKEYSKARQTAVHDEPEVTLELRGEEQVVLSPKDGGVKVELAPGTTGGNVQVDVHEE